MFSDLFPASQYYKKHNYKYLYTITIYYVFTHNCARFIANVMLRNYDVVIVTFLAAQSHKTKHINDHVNNMVYLNELFKY